MPWLTDAIDAIAWMVTETATGHSPQEVRQSFEQIGGSAIDFSSWYAYQVRNQPDPGSPGAAFRPLLSVLGQWLTTARPQSQLQGTSPTTATPSKSSSGAIPGFSGDPAVVQAIIKAAQDMGVDPRLALAIAQHESSFNPQAEGDHGCSKGVFQLNTCTGEGVGVPDYLLNDPYSNAKIALQKVREVQQANPGASAGQIAALAQRPADASAYADAINQNVDSIMTGTGSLSWATTALQNPQLGGLGSTANQLGGAGVVPLPFPVDYFRNVTERFGDSFGGSHEMGTDFGMPVGTQIQTPVGGTIQLRDDGKANWGKAVYVKMPNGWTYFVGHMSSFAVSDGEQVSAGSVLGVSGGDPSDPSSGNSTGPHVEVQFQDPSGHVVDPMPFLNQLFAGTTFGSWAGGAFLGSSQVQGQAQSLSRTGDGKIIDYNTPQGAWYKTVDQAWSAIYGQHAPLQAALDFRNAGITTTDALQSAINNLPSNIPGVTIGQYKGVSDATQKQAQTAFGRSVPQSLVAELIHQGITNPGDIQLWFESHGSSSIPTGEYQSIYDAAAPYTQSLYSDVPHPADIATIYANANGASTGTGTNDPVAKTISDYVAGVF